MLSQVCCYYFGRGAVAFVLCAWSPQTSRGTLLYMLAYRTIRRRPLILSLLSIFRLGGIFQELVGIIVLSLYSVVSRHDGLK